MRALDTDVAVIGAGPAGLAAALAARAAGARVIVLDEYPTPGGQFYKQLAPEYRVGERARLPAEYTRGDALLARVRDARIEILNDSLVWNAEPGLVCLRQPGSMATLACRALVIACGAYERPAAFPGWDLPGIMTPGGAQTLVKAQRCVPGGRIVLAGCGPFLLPVAVSLLEAGAELGAIYELTRPRQWLRHAARLWGHGARIAEGLGYWRAIKRARVPVRFGYVVTAARGTDALERVDLARCDAAGRAIPGTAVSEPAAVLCASLGFVPAVQLTRLLGCEHRYDELRGGWVPVHAADMATTVAGVFVAGEAAGIGGAHAALAEGELAGMAAAASIGYALGAARHARARREAQRHRAFGDLVNTVFRVPPGVVDAITDDTIVCRCEEVSAGAVREAIRPWAADANMIKALTRCGMGYCQGRICGPLLEAMIARKLDIPAHAVESLRVRAPIKPVPAGELASYAE